MDDMGAIADSLSLSDEQSYILGECTFFGSKVKSEENRKKIISRMRYQQNIEKTAGFENDKFRGNEIDFYQRYLYESGSYSGGILTSKDAGEPGFADFYSGFFRYDDDKMSITAGDFQLETGMGGLFWRSFGMRKGAEVISPVISIGRGVRPYRSAYEAGYFRGAAAENSFVIGGSKLNIMAWASFAGRGANIDSSGIARSIDMTGYHRTENEISKKNKLLENNFGGMTEIETGNFIFGITSYYLAYDKEVRTRSSTAFYGKSGLLSSGHIFYSSQDFSFAGEIIRDAGNNFGFKAGLQKEIDQFDLALYARSFPKEFRSPFGYSFAESSFPGNETGLYAGVKWSNKENLQLNIYADIYKTPVRTYLIGIPVRGIDLLGDIEYELSDNAEITLRLRHENKSHSDPLSTKDFFQKLRTSARFEINQNPAGSSKLRFRLEAVNCKFENAMPEEYGFIGFLEYSDYILDYIRLGGRLTYFSTDSYESAIWQFEYAMPGMMTTTPLHGKGLRTYFYGRIEILDYADIWLRYDITTKNDTEVIGSGLNEINGNSRSRFTVQVDFTY